MPSRAGEEPLRSPHRPPAWVGDIIAAILIVGAVVVPYPDPALLPQDPLQVAASLLPAALLPLRRRWPLGVLGACVAIYIACGFLGFISPGVLLAVVVAMFGAANRLPRRSSLVALGVIVVVIATAATITLGDIFEPRVFQVVVSIALAAAGGDATRSRREYLDAVTERAIRAEQTREAEAMRAVSEERLRIARDLHDAVAHQISVVSLNAGVATSALESRPEKAREALATIRSASRAVLREIGDLLAVLRAEEPRAGGGAADAPQPSLRQLDALVASFGASELAVVTRVEGDPARLPIPSDAVAFRVVQEGLTNALKHGSEHRAHVLIDVADESARIIVTNPVDRSTELRDPDAPVGFGLIGLRERVAAVRGTMETGDSATGFRLVVTLPIPEEEER